MNEKVNAVYDAYMEFMAHCAPGYGAYAGEGVNPVTESFTEGMGVALKLIAEDLYTTAYEVYDGDRDPTADEQQKAKNLLNMKVKDFI